MNEKHRIFARYARKFFTIWANIIRKLLILCEGNFHFMREPTNLVVS
jgi:hypothetical protein